MRLSSIDYNADEPKTYYDPVLHWSAPWVDTIQYGDGAAPVAWERKTNDGKLVLSSPTTLADGRSIRYVLEETKKGRTLSMLIETD